MRRAAVTRFGALVFVGALLASACASSETVSAPQPDAPVTSAPVTTIDSPASSETTAAPTTSGPPTTAAPAASIPVQPARVGPVEPTDLPVTELDMPADWFVTDLAVGDEIVVSAEPAGGGGLSRLWVAGQPVGTATDVGSLFPEQSFAPVVTEVLAFGDRYFAFLMGDESAEDRTPTVLVSADGVDWSVATMGVLAPAGFSTRAAAATPESPPYPGASAVTDAVVYTTGASDTPWIAATGWATFDGVIRAVVWRTADGDRWTEHVLPRLAFDTEYGSQIGADDAGYVVRVGGPVHTGVGVVVSRNATDWERVPDDVAGDGNSWTQWVGVNDVFQFLLVVGIDSPTTLWSTEDGDVWRAVEIVEPDTIDEAWWRLEASSWHDPIIFRNDLSGQADQPPPTMWTLDRGTWEGQKLAGERVVSADADHIATRAADTLYVYDRRWPPGG